MRACGAIVLLLSVATGCQCAGVAPSTCFSGEPCAGGGDAGTDAGAPDAGDAGAISDAGFDAGPADAGEDAGDDGGSDAGVDAGPEFPITNRFPALGICEAWGCILGRLDGGQPLAVPPGFTKVQLPFSGITSSCPQKFLGGVWLPDGRVLAIPFCADHFLIIDPVAQTAAPIGGLLPTPGPEGAYAGGVLGCDGQVWAIPSTAAHLLRVVLPPDGGLITSPFSPSFATGPRSRGGIVGVNCNDFHLWSSQPTRMMRQHLYTRMLIPGDLPPGATTPFTTSGLVRVLDGSVLIAARTSTGVGVWMHTVPPVEGNARLFVTNDGGIFQGAAAGQAQAAYFVSPATGDTWRYDAVTNSIDLRPGPVGATFTGYQWPAFRGDGFIYALGQSLLAIADFTDGGTFQLFDGEFADAGNPFGGLVVTSAGLVGIPAEFPDVLLLIPDGGQTAPREVLLSPYFNKL